ncbi:MAG TPA: DoxX family membrane protein [Gemmatimonadaceae bacterium]|nr:DoxX family membrane protein [Gemmatimonadaceae bacterium]
MSRNQQIVRILFATGMMSVGVVVLVYGYSVLLFQSVPPSWATWLKPVGWASGIIMFGTGLGLLFERSARLSTRILLPFLLLWLLTRLPAVPADPLREISWFAIGEVAVPFAGALVLFMWFADSRTGSTLQSVAATYGLTTARILVGLSLLTFGLSHFFEFAARTVSLVPPWLPYRAAWADLAGAAQIAAGLGVLFSIYPRWAAAAEAAMLSVFTVLVWVPAVITKPGLPSNWVEFLFTWALAAACWVVAESIPAKGTRRARAMTASTG